MNIKLSLLAIIEILSGLSIGIIIMIITYQMLKWIGRKRYDIHQNNAAYSIFIASVLFAVGYMVSGVVQPLLSLFRIMAASGGSTSAFFHFLDTEQYTLLPPMQPVSLLACWELQSILRSLPLMSLLR